jgi:hypothetical protein
VGLRDARPISTTCDGPSVMIREMRQSHVSRRSVALGSFPGCPDLGSKLCTAAGFDVGKIDMDRDVGDRLASRTGIRAGGADLDQLGECVGTHLRGCAARVLILQSAGHCVHLRA